MRFSLRTLLIVLVIGPPLLAGASVAIDRVITALRTPATVYCCPDIVPALKGPRYLSTKELIDIAKERPGSSPGGEHK